MYQGAVVVSFNVVMATFLRYKVVGPEKVHTAPPANCSIDMLEDNTLAAVAIVISGAVDPPFCPNITPPRSSKLIWQPFICASPLIQVPLFCSNQFPSSCILATRASGLNVLP